MSEIRSKDHVYNSEHRNFEIQLSSGQGPRECELAVAKLAEALKKEYPDIQILDTIPGKDKGNFRSVRIASTQDLSHLEGTVKWICQSPYRPEHKRKNWFVDVSLCAKSEALPYDESLIRFETFRSGGKGGQHVNKVETGVRAIYLPTGLSVVSTEARSQHVNKQLALNRLCQIICEHNEASFGIARSLDRLEHYRIERGNPVRTYSGPDFRRVL